MSGAPRRAALRELGPGERHDVERARARPLEQVFDEVEQARVRPLQVLEQEHCRESVCKALEEQAPGGEQVRLVGRSMLLEAEQLGEPGLDEAALACIQQMLGECRAQLAERRIGRFVLGDP